MFYGNGLYEIRLAGLVNWQGRSSATVYLMAESMGYAIGLINFKFPGIEIRSITAFPDGIVLTKEQLTT